MLVSNARGRQDPRQQLPSLPLSSRMSLTAMLTSMPPGRHTHVGRVIFKPATRRLRRHVRAVARPSAAERLSIFFGRSPWPPKSATAIQALSGHLGPPDPRIVPEHIGLNRPILTIHLKFLAWASTAIQEWSAYGGGVRQLFNHWIIVIFLQLTFHALIFIGFFDVRLRSLIYFSLLKLRSAVFCLIYNPRYSVQQRKRLGSSQVSEGTLLPPQIFWGHLLRPPRSFARIRQKVPSESWKNLCSTPRNKIVRGTFNRFELHQGGKPHPGLSHN